MEVFKCWKTKKFPKVSIKMKKFKTFYKVQVAANRSKEIIQFPPDKGWRKIFSLKYTEIYRHLLSKCFKDAAPQRLEMVQCKCFFLAPTRNMLAGKFVKRVRSLAVLREYIFYKVEWVEIRKMSKVFWAKIYCKMSDLFC